MVAMRQNAVGAVFFLFLATHLTERLVAGALFSDNVSDPFLNTVQLIKKYGYPAESHSVLTEDGYILRVHRVPPKPQSRKRYPIYIHHGLSGSSADFLYNGPGKSLVFMLASQGYDVWMANMRGNSYSRSHLDYSTRNSRFWDFSWHEAGVYDVTATIDYIISKTGKKQIFFVGYSMGTTVFFVMASTRPEYQKRVKGAIMLAPVIFMKHVKFPLKYKSIFGTKRKQMSRDDYAREFVTQPAMIYPNLTSEDNATSRALFDSQKLNLKVLPTVIFHYPAGTSAKTVIHYWQVLSSDRFAMFDYGWMENLKKYGQIYPLNYNLKVITSNVEMFLGNKDIVATIKDAKLLARIVPSVRKLHIIPRFGHLDFVFAQNIKTLLYDRVLDRISVMCGENIDDDLDYGIGEDLDYDYSGLDYGYQYI